jgi:hypothetical protein
MNNIKTTSENGLQNARKEPGSYKNELHFGLEIFG